MRSIPFSAALLLFLASPTIAGAHHGSAQGPGESLRTLNSLGNNVAPRQRVSLLTAASRSSAEPNLNRATIYSLSALTTLSLNRRVFTSASLPMVVVDEDVSPGVKVGLGNLRAGFHLRLGDLDGPDTASWTVGLSLSFPTRTFRFAVDPGRQWVIAPGIRYADNHERLLWYGVVLTPLETRPTGTAVDVSAAAGLGYRILPRFSLTGGVAVDVRAATWCQGVDGTEFCQQGRATESNRPLGATRLSANMAASYDFAKDWSAFFNGQLPLTTRRDVEWSASLGVEFRF